MPLGAPGLTTSNNKATSNKCIASSNKCIATSNKCLTSSNKKLLGLLALLLVTIKLLLFPVSSPPGHSVRSTRRLSRERSHPIKQPSARPGRWAKAVAYPRPGARPHRSSGVPPKIMRRNWT